MEFLSRKETQIFLLLGIYIIIMVAIGLKSYKKANSLTNFVVGGRKAGPWMSAFAYGTSYFSSVIFIGYAGKSGWEFGLWAILIGLGNALIGSLLAWVVLGERTRDVTKRLKIKTMPQFFEKRYQSKNMKYFASIVIFIFMLPYSASVYSGLSYLCETILNINYYVAMGIIALIAAVYLILGGYLASLKADFVQGIIMIGGIILMVIVVVNSDFIGGIQNGISNLQSEMDNAGILSMNGQTTLGLISLILLTSLGTWGLPQMTQKFYGISSKKAVKTATIVSTVFALIISCGAYFIGSLARLFPFTSEAATNGAFDTIVPQILDKTLPGVLLGVVLVLVLSASVSTLSSITLTSCSTMTMDVLGNVKKLNLDKKKTFTLTRILCLCFIAFSYIIASVKSPILMLMSFSWGTIAGSFLAPYLFGLIWKKGNKTGAWSAIIVGFSVSLLCAIFSGFNAGNAALFGVIAMISSFIAYPIGSLVGIKLGGKSKEVPKTFFDKNFTLQIEEVQN